jgi:hypothetical protein
MVRLFLMKVIGATLKSATVKSLQYVSQIPVMFADLEKLGESRLVEVQRIRILAAENAGKSSDFSSQFHLA